MEGIVVNYWIGVASEDHVKLGVSEGFSQLCHGKQAPLKRMKTGDWLIYYAPKRNLEANEPYQHFVAIGQILEGEAYPFEMAPDFIPYRKDVSFIKECVPLPLKALTDVPLWQEFRSRLRFGHFQIPKELFKIIATGMNVGIV
ncbi:EVE domain-containing protein [Enterococcus rivorum]|uniref:UPF0310 protein BCR26_16705 n=1 Tax=Enterococcus rivorum TaxID=762845 RepID=A0A1E5KU23_9ENTE|nr:EVE domain-containing protein [Enterococcus rivorum]OEH81385.1 EVE domain-containing protein [Enterococcus rivorum]